MPYDPNDPNQGSQAPPEDQATPEWQAKNATTTGTINDLVRSRPVIAQWLASHNDGRTLSDSDKAQLFQLLRVQGIDPTNLEVDGNGTISWPKHTVRDIALGSLMALGPVAAAWAVPAIASAAGAGAGAGAGAAGAETAAAGGVLPSTITAAGSAALPAGLSGSAVTTGAGLAGLASAGGADVAASAGADAAANGAFDEAGNFIGDSTISSVAPTSGIGTWASRLGKLSDAASQLGEAFSGQDSALAGTGAANAASQAARNRILGAQVDLSGPSADKTALSNMRTAGLVSNFKDVPASAFGNPGITIGDPTRNFASKFQTELAARMANGKSLTLSGVPDPTPQELADEATARAASQGRSTLPGTAGRVINTINTGARLADQVRKYHDLWSSF